MSSKNILSKQIHKWKYKLIVIILLSFPDSSFSQTGTITGSGKVTYNTNGTVTVSGTKMFTSHIVTSSEDVENMVQLDAISLFSENTDLSGGIKSQINNGGSVILKIYSYDETQPSKKGNVIYQIKSTTTSTTSFVGSPEMIAFGNKTISSDKIKVLLSTAKTFLVDKSKATTGLKLDLFTTTMAYLNSQVNPFLVTPLSTCIRGNNYKLLQPIIVDVTVFST